MKRKKLVIISHTEHYKEGDEIKGWGATVHEINYLAQYWEEVVHVACFYNEIAPPSSVAYNLKNIKYVPIPSYGGRTFLKKLGILWKMPLIIKTVKKNLVEATEVQLRTPTAMGLFLLPLFTFIWKRNYTFWVKYAGDWEQEKPPRSNGWQRWFLQQKWINFPVTINGFWPNQAKHCFSFENPCLTLENIKSGKEKLKNKMFQPPFVFCFVGRIDHVKGVDRIIDALCHIPNEYIKVVHIIGDGPDKSKTEKLAKNSNLNIVFHGFLDRGDVHKYLQDAHFFLLPSTNEGFPKVIAEAACYGTIPIVSNVSSIKHYLNEFNSYIWDVKGSQSYCEVFKFAVMDNLTTIKEKSESILCLAEQFTFDNYYNKLITQVLKREDEKKF
jgi:glycosyltransferase involved in cell wall biosynthesis